MAIYHLTARVGTRQGGESAQGKSQYITRTGKYKRDAAEVVHYGHGNMPKWVEGKPFDCYWGAADCYERLNGTLYREVEFALPIELNEKQRLELVEKFIDETVKKELPYLYAIHKGKGHNPHCHFMFSERLNDGHSRTQDTWFKRAANKGLPSGSGGARKIDIGGNRKLWIKTTRKVWEDCANSALRLAGFDQRIDHRSYAEQGIRKIPGIHLGPGASGMEQRNVSSDRGKMSQGVIKANSAIEKLDKEIEWLKYKHHGIAIRLDSADRASLYDDTSDELNKAKTLELEELDKNKAQELEELIRKINFAEYLRLLGFAHEQNQIFTNAIVMVHGKEKILLVTDKTESWKFVSVNNPQDHGNIFEFISSRNSASEEQIYSHLNSWVCSHGECATISKPPPINQDEIKIIIDFLQFSYDGDRFCFEELGINDLTIEDKRFASLVRFGNDNVIFPHTSNQKMVGFEIHSYDNAGFTADGKRGVWHSSNLNDANKIVIVNNGIEALSHAQLYSDSDVAYIGLGDTLTEFQQELVLNLLESISVKDCEVIVATSDNISGRNFATSLMEIIPSAIRSLPCSDKWSYDCEDELGSSMRM